MGIMMLRPLLMAHFLDVQEFAYYGAGLLISSTFCMLGCIGLQSLLQREMPKQFMRGRNMAANILLAQCIIVASICAVLGLVLSVAGFEFASLDREVIAISILHGMGQQLFLLVTVESRSRGETLRYSGQQLVRAVLVIVLAGLVAVTFDAAKLVLLVEALVSLALSVKILLRVPGSSLAGFQAVFKLALSRLGSVPWRSAIALFAVMVVSFLVLNIDRWLAASFLSSAVFAQYTFAWILLLVAQSLQAIVNTSVFPLMARNFAKSGKGICFRTAAIASFLLLSLGTVAAWPAIVIIEILIANYYPDYEDSTTLLSFFLCVGILRVSDFWSSYLVVVGLEKRLLFVNLFVVFSVSAGWFGFNWALIPNGLQVTNLATLLVCLTVFSYVAVFVTALLSRR
ncbi:hypothetical protein Mag101_07565 [Microbulbifer agarilyticus]|uniref:Polysaccharide biosynthesis protein n=1 Tax=Microbulbifer agarilyticus TaxID=260552 RepID=A0A1Q2M4C9_9GAMM|nr:hypothetical protein [Microbulbifer agarilyticus]AQQ67510.1 hypothetical protein Mag101_07565 [Microbulbifer agarilyticus]